jgi:hypothetical protein
MNESTIVASISLFVSVAGMFILSNSWAAFMVDDTRNHLFSVRDEMFLYAVDRELLDTAAYQNLRKLMNGLIRYAHKMTLTNFISLIIGRDIFNVPYEAPPVLVEWKDSADAPGKEGECLKEFHARAAALMIRQMLCRSIFLATIWFVLGLFSKKEKSATMKAIADNDRMESIEADALADFRDDRLAMAA